MKRIIAFLGLTLMLIIGISPPVHSQQYLWNNTAIVNKSLSVGKVKTRIADTCALLELGDTATGKGLLLPRTDTTKVLKKKPGLLIWNRKDSCLYIYDGKRWQGYQKKS